MLAEEGLVGVLCRVGFIPLVGYAQESVLFSLFRFLCVGNGKCLDLVSVWGYIRR